MLVNLQISQWTARKLNRAETTAINRNHGLSIEAARVNVNLLPLAVELDRVHQITGAIRKDFDRRTLPWGLQGINILKTESYMEFCQEANRWREDWEGAVDDFITAYPQLLEEAKLLLNGLFDAAHYPEPDEIKRKFAFNLRFLPVPDERDWRITVGDEVSERLKVQLTAQIAEAEANAMQVAWKRIFDVVERARERLSTPDAIFRDTMITQATELCSLLPSLNIANDPRLETMRQELERSLCRHNPDTLRSDPLVRQEVADKMADIQKKMGAFFK